MAPELVSCVIPVYNAERYLGETLDSVLAQTYRSFEVIVIDDGSTDSTPDIVAAHGDRIRCLRQANAGAAAARNRGIEAAQSEFIALGDGDDLWHPERLSRQMVCFAERPELDICLSHVESFWSSEESDQDYAFHDPRAGVVTTAMVARRTLFDRIGFFDTSLRRADHQDWYLRALEDGVIIELLPDVLHYRRLHETNMVRVQAADYATELAEIVKHSLDRRRRVDGRNAPPLELPESPGRT